MARFEELYPPYVAFGSRDLSGGERGSDVAVLQTIYNQALRVMNPPLGPLGQPIPVTGTFDPATKQAVRNVQSYFGISVDGIAGPATYFLFGQGVDGDVTYGGPRYGSRELQQGMTGGDVTVLQNRLNLFRYSSQIGAPADGVFGAKTAAAVSQFQHDAIANGDTGLATSGVVTTGTFDATWIYTLAGGRGIFTGRNGFDVVFIQLLLRKLGFYGGPVHGYYDAATQAAVTAFQHSAGIAADGTVGQATYYALGQRNQVAAPSPMPVPPLGQAVPTPLSDCCFTLTPQIEGPEPFETPGGVVWVRQVQLECSTGVDFAAMALHLPPPTKFDPCYTAYILSVSDPSIFLAKPMEEVSSEQGIWIRYRSQSYGGPLPPTFTVTIQPGVPYGATGPVVLQGTLGACH